MATKTAQTSNPTDIATVSIPLTVVTIPVNHGAKPEKFLGTDFKRW